MIVIPRLSLRSNLGLKLANAFGVIFLTLPQPARHEPYVGFEAIGAERDRAFLFGAHVGSHEKLGYFQAIVKILIGLLSIEKALNEVAILVARILHAQPKNTVVHIRLGSGTASYRAAAYSTT